MSRHQHAIPFAQPKFSEYEVYETPDTVYLVAKGSFTCKSCFSDSHVGGIPLLIAFTVSSVGVLTTTMYKVINIDRSWDEPYPLSALLSEDASMYNSEQLKNLRASIGLLRRTPGVGVLGFTRFLRGYSLILITQRRIVGTIGGHVIYAVESTATIPVSRYNVSYQQYNFTMRKSKQYMLKIMISCEQDKPQTGKKLAWFKTKMRFKRSALEYNEVSVCRS